MILATNRWYNNEVRIWLSSDPIEYEGGENLYEYVGGRQVIGLDPDGLTLVYNRSTKAFPYKPETRSVIRFCRPGMLCDVDGIYTPNQPFPEIKIPNSCLGYVDSCGKPRVHCIAPNERLKPFVDLLRGRKASQQDYYPSLLDDQCFHDRTDWPRLTMPK